jgi:hypothetical protein
MKRIRHGILLLLILMTILQACNEHKIDDDMSFGIPLN